MSHDADSTEYTIRDLGLPGDDALDSTQQGIIDPQRERLGFVPNMYRAMVNQPALLATYLEGYRRFRAETGLRPVEQEVVLLAISMDNGCHYCTAAHSMLADKMSGVPSDVLEAIRSGEEIPDAKLKALHATARAVSGTRGRPDRATIEAFLAEGYTEADLLSIVLAVSVKVISNYTNHLFDTPIDDVFSPYAM